MIETYKRQCGPELLHRIINELSRLHGRKISIDEVSTIGAPPKAEAAEAA